MMIYTHLSVSLSLQNKKLNCVRALQLHPAIAFILDTCLSLEWSCVVHLYLQSVFLPSNILKI